MVFFRSHFTKAVVCESKHHIFSVASSKPMPWFVTSHAMVPCLHEPYPKRNSKLRCAEARTMASLFQMSRDWYISARMFITGMGS